MTHYLAAARAGRFRPELLFRPQSVAVIGADRADGAGFVAALLAGGFGGPVLPVAAGRPSVAGVFAYGDIGALPLAPDLALVCAEPDAVPEAIAALAARGGRAAIIPGGITGAAGSLAGLARAHGMRILGPEAFGIAVPACGREARPGAGISHPAPRPGRVALVSQSGALCRAVLDWAEPHRVGFSYVIGGGAHGDIGFGMILDWLSRDSDTGAILLDIRGIKDRRLFLSAARAAARLRPMVALHAGGLLMDPSGAAEAVFQAALGRCGVLSVRTLGELLAAAETLTRARPARGETVAIVADALGPARLAADAALRAGLSLVGPDAASDGITLVPPEADLAASITRMAAEAGGVVVVHAPSAPAASGATTLAALAAAVKAAPAPVLVCALGETSGAAWRRDLAASGVPVFAEPEAALQGFLHLVRDRRNRAAARELPAAKVLTLAPDLAAVRRLINRARIADVDYLDNEDALAVMAAYGLPTLPTRAAEGVEDAVSAASILGFPVVLKRRRAGGPRLGLALDLADPIALRDAARVLLRRPGPQAGLLVQRQAGRAREIAITVREDAIFGPAISLGPGGVTAEARDAAIELPPLNLALAAGLLTRSSRATALLAAQPDLPAADTPALAEVLVRVSQMIVDLPEIDALTINPLFVDAEGVAVADVMLRLRPPGAAARLALSPYPAELARRITIRGAAYTLRPIRPEDAEEHGALFSRLAPDDIRYRFFTPLRSLPAEQLARLTQVDYEREIAFVAVREATGETVGVARLVHETDAPDAEFAIAVQPDAKGAGIGRALMEQIFAWARTRGISEIAGEVLAENAPMIAFVRRLGFTIARLPGEAGVMAVRMALEAYPP